MTCAGESCHPAAHPKGAMMIIKWLKLAGTAILVYRASTSLQAAAVA
jgi:hypothetical protein